MPDIWFLVALIASVLVAFLVGRFLFKSPSPVAPNIDSSLARLEERERYLGGQLDTTNQQIAELTKSLESTKEELTSTREKASKSQALVDEYRGQIDKLSEAIQSQKSLENNLRDQLDDARQQVSQKATELASASERENGLKKLIEQRAEELTAVQTELRTEFENIANRVLGFAAAQLSENSANSLGPILEPLRQKISDFQQKVESTHVEDTRQRSALEQQIRHIIETHLSIGKQAENLAKALKGDSQIRGRWGEVQLERILERSGLVKGREFVVQGGDFKMKTADGAAQRPDVIVLLPENRHFVIDSKVSLIDYAQYESAETDDEKAACIKKVLASVKGHINNLAEKKYQHAGAINSHDLVFMFVPIEGVLALALNTDHNLLDHAWNRGIVLVSPSTLFMAMKTVGAIWRHERQNENAQQIAKYAGDMYDKLAAFVLDLNTVGARLQSATDAHNEALKKLSVGRGNVLSKAQKLKSMSIHTGKEMPRIKVDGFEVEVFEEGSDEDAVEISTDDISQHLISQNDKTATENSQ